ncbi:MAG: ABC transporter permease [Sarcina sp.]
MLKYIYGFKLQILSAMNYRLNTIIDLVFRNVSIYITILFWMLIYNNKSDINNYNINDIITYFIMISLFSNLVLNNAGFEINAHIKEGYLNSLILKPWNHKLVNYFTNMAVAVGNVVPQLIVTIAVVMIFSDEIVYKINLLNIIFLICFLIIASITSYLVWRILGYMAFWIEEASSVMWSFAILFNFIAGNFIPLDFFPKEILDIIKILPFSNWGYIPTRVYMGIYEFKELIWLTLINILWVIILMKFEKLVWNSGIQRYVSIGG